MAESVLTKAFSKAVHNDLLVAKLFAQICPFHKSSVFVQCCFLAKAIGIPRSLCNSKLPKGKCKYPNYVPIFTNHNTWGIQGRVGGTTVWEWFGHPPSLCDVVTNLTFETMIK